MIHITTHGTVVRLVAGKVSVDVKGLNGKAAQHTEDEIRTVFRAAAISHRVRNFASEVYSAPTKIYLEQDRRILSLETECGVEVELDGSFVQVLHLLETALVPVDASY